MRQFDDHRRFSPTAQGAVDPGLGELPEWNLADLYAAPSSQALKDDYAKAERKAAAFAKNIRESSLSLPRRMAQSSPVQLENLKTFKT